MIISKLPLKWQELQDETARVLRECGLEVSVEKNITIARGTAEIDMFAEDLSQTPSSNITIVYNLGSH